jgi:hypothetical protein
MYESQVARRGVAVLVGLAALVIGSLVSAGTALTRTNDSFCEIAQYYSADTAHKPTTVVHADFDSFKKSKTSVAPLEIHQFVQYADGERKKPRRISCKLKSRDHLVAQYGAAAAGAVQHTCRDLHHRMVRNVFEGLSADERARAQFPLERVRLEADTKTLLGSKWVTDFSYVWAQPEDELHLAAKALHVDYTDWRWRLAPEKFRGVYYCHLIAPEYLRDILLGTESPPPRTSD